MTTDDPRPDFAPPAWPAPTAAQDPAWPPPQPAPGWGPPTVPWQPPPPPSPLPTSPTTYPHFWRTSGIAVWKPILIVFVGAVAFLIVTTGVVVVAMLIEVAFSGVDPEALLLDLAAMRLTPLIVFANSLALGVMLPVAIGLGLIAGQRGGYLSSVTGRFRWRFAWLAGAVALGMLLLYTVISASGEDLGLTVYPYTWWLLVGMMLVTPFQAAAEEYLFRGLLFRAIGSWMPTPLLALIVGGVLNAALFAVVHVSTDPWLNLFYFSLGLLLSYLTWRTGGLEAAVAIHVANNMVGMALLPFQDLTEVLDRSAGSGSPVVALQLLAVAVAAAVIVWLARRRNLARTGPTIL